MKLEQLKTLQQQLMDFMLDDSNTAITESISLQGNISTETRLNIYRNAYQIRLKETIETDHPQLGIYLGDELFGLMVEGYIKSNPSSQSSLRQFADKLPDFLKSTLPFKDHPAISDIARFERLLLSAFDAADCERFSRTDLEQIPQESWPTMKIRFHPSMQIFTCDSNAVDIWRAIKHEQSPPDYIQQENHWLVWRNAELLTEFQSIKAEQNLLLTLALQGQPFEVLCEALLPYIKEEQIINEILGYLFAWLEKGIIRHITEQ